MIIKLTPVGLLTTMRQRSITTRKNILTMKSVLSMLSTSVQCAGLPAAGRKIYCQKFSLVDNLHFSQVTSAPILISRYPKAVFKRF